VSYSWVVREERIGDRRWLVECIDDFEAEVATFCDRMLAEGRSYREFEDLCPMFGAVWPAARALAHRVAAEGEALRGRAVLELGCGVALPSLVAASLGASVVASDQHPDAGDLLARNARRNGDLAVRYASFDWRGALPDGVPERGFRHVVASDVVYAATMPELVAATFERFLAPDGVGWLTDPGRAWLEDFSLACRTLGLCAHLDVCGEGDHEAFLVTIARPTGARRGG
jgi:predicted nicotinamide N-methyase